MEQSRPEARGGHPARPARYRRKTGLDSHEGHIWGQADVPRRNVARSANSMSRRPAPDNCRSRARADRLASSKAAAGLRRSNRVSLICASRPGPGLRTGRLRSSNSAQRHRGSQSEAPLAPAGRPPPAQPVRGSALGRQRGAKRNRHRLAFARPARLVPMGRGSIIARASGGSARMRCAAGH